METVTGYEAAVIGAGAGGCCAAARLAHAGLRTLLIDDHDCFGGWASTEIIDGHIVNVGAIALEAGGVFEETFDLVGAALPIRMPQPANAFYLDRNVVDVGRGGWGLLLRGLTKQAARILDQFAAATPGSLPDGRLSTKDWLAGYTRNETVHAIFRNLCAAIFACNADKLPARAFLTYFTAKGTVALAGSANIPADYVRKVRETLRPAANIVFNFASRSTAMAVPRRAPKRPSSSSARSCSAPACFRRRNEHS